MPERPWKPSRRERRVLLALLSGASNLSGYPIGRAAQVGSGRVYVTLAKLEKQAYWVVRDQVPGGRAFYRLTPAGRHAVMGLCGLEDEYG
jgi:DNA-binding PadR family transcriptional regulator